MKEQTISDIVSMDYRYADVFYEYGIDFCCGGSVTLEKVCQRKHINPEELIHKLEKVVRSTDFTMDYNTWGVRELVNHIICSHHEYIRINIPLLLKYATKVAAVHSGNMPQLKTIPILLQVLEKKLQDQMEKEERVLFPDFIAISDLDFRKKINLTLFKNNITLLASEHEDAVNTVKEFTNITNNYFLPEYACNTFRIMYQKLIELEKDLMLHIHIENNTLFPAVLQKLS